MNIVAFEDARVERLGVLVAARPACDLLLGAFTLVETLGHIGRVRRAVRPHLARHLAALDGRRIAAWGGEADAAWQPAASRHGAIVLVVNARLVPSRPNLAALRGLVEAGRRGIVAGDDGIAAALLHESADGGGPDHGLVEDLVARGPAAVDRLTAAGLPPIATPLDLISAAHDVVTQHERALEEALAMRIDSGSFPHARPGLFADPTARIDPLVAVRHGPVVVAAGAEIGPFVCIDGPVWIGPDARINPHTWLRAGTAVGRGCRVGGEVEQTVLEPFANKPHGGFLGHSHVGSWVNIAAGTTTGNLKATYGPVRLHRELPDGTRDTIHTGRQFLGALIGDFTKTAVNTALPCGARIGVAATLGGTVPEQVAPFTNQLLGGRSTAAQAATILERMMARRGLPSMPADLELLEAIASREAG